jgi:hypothetical protein
MESLKILLLAVSAAVVYGIVHDQVTARICVEYFTIGHAPIFGTDDPTLLGLGWGVLATWWVGVLLGVPLVVVARAGSRPKRSAQSLVRPIGWLMLSAALGATIAGFIGWIAASRRWVWLDGRFAEEVPPEQHIPFLIDGFAHTASYGVGFVGGIVVLAVVWYGRLTAR